MFLFLLFAVAVAITIGVASARNRKPAHKTANPSTTTRQNPGHNSKSKSYLKKDSMQAMWDYENGTSLMPFDFDQ